MRDARKEIVQSLIAAINVKLPSRTVYTIVPKSVENSGTMPPDNYIYISDIYQNDSSSKNDTRYSYEVLIQVVKNNITSKLELYSEVNSIMTIIQNERDLTLSNDFDLIYMGFIANSEEEIQTETGTKHLGLIRFQIDVQDNL